MDYVHKLEATVASWYKGVPHLSPRGQKWLADNAWWLTLVGVILCAIGVFVLIAITLVAGAVLVGFGGIVGAAIGGIALIAVLASLVFAIFNIVVGAVAIAPLKALQKKGWTLLFIITLVNVLSLVVTFLLNFNIFALIWGALFAALGGYFLFEIRSFYSAEPRIRKAVVKTAAKKPE